MWQVCQGRRVLLLRLLDHILRILSIRGIRAVCILAVLLIVALRWSVQIRLFTLIVIIIAIPFIWAVIPTLSPLLLELLLNLLLCDLLLLRVHLLPGLLSHAHIVIGVVTFLRICLIACTIFFRVLLSQGLLGFGAQESICGVILFIVVLFLEHHEATCHLINRTDCFNTVVWVIW